MKRFYQKRFFIVLPVLLLLVGGGVFWYAKTAFGVTRTWDGGGVDGTCGGAGTANNWTCAANWSADTVPTSSDTAVFDGTSTKNATINANLSAGTAPAGISMNAGYSGTITQATGITISVGSSGFTQAAGTFSGGNSNMTINGVFSLSAGTFTSTSSQFLVANGGNWTHTAGGTFDHNNGTVSFAQGCVSITVDVATSETFYNLSQTGGCGDNDHLVVATGDTLIVLGTFTRLGGAVDTGTIEARGNVIVSNGGSVGGTGTLSFLVTGDQTITSTSGSLPGLNINKASGTVSVTGNLSIKGLTLSSGVFTSTSGTLTIDRGGNWTHTAGGTWNHNNGTVSFSQSCASNTVDVATSETFYNLSQTGGCGGNDQLNITSGDTLITLGTFTHTDGSVKIGMVEAQGNVVISAGADGGTATLSFTGGNNQTYTDSGGNEPDGDVTVNKSGGTVTLASGADWNAASQDVTITAGTLSSATYNITTNNFTVNGGTFTGGSGTLTTAGPMLVSSGTFTGGAGNVTVNNTYTLSGGTFTAPSGILQVGRNNLSETIFTISGGTFNHNNGTVKFAPSREYTPGQTYTVDVATSLTLYNVETNCLNTQAVSSVTTAAGDTIIAAGNFTQTEGALSGTWEVQGNITIASTADGGGGTLTFTGTGSKTYTYTTGGTGPHVRVNNAGVSVFAASGTTDLKVSLFSLLAGTFAAPSGTFEVGRNNLSETIFTISGGTFNHNNGTVKFAPSREYTPGQTYTVDVATSLTLYNVETNCLNTQAVSSVTTAAGDTIIASGNFTHTDGALNGTWEVQGNYTVSAGADGGTATLTFTGGSTQTYTDQGGNEPDGDVTINKAANGVTLASNADWNAASQDLTITAGTLLQLSNYAVATGAVTVGASGKWVNNGTGAVTLGGAVANAGLIDFRSSNTCGGSDTIALHSSSNGVQRAWSGAGTVVMRDIEVKDQGGSAAITAYSSTSTSGNGGNWTFSGAACPAVPTPKSGLPSGYTRLQGGKVNLR